MPLITSTTQLNKWKFGKGPWSDKRNGGNSNQPYINRDIPGVQYDNPNQTFESMKEQDDLPLRSGPDFLLRNGFLAPADAARDVSRLSQMFFDLKSPNGALFIAKENLLSRTAVKTEASYGLGYGVGKVNAGIYTPLSTLAQAAVGFTGTHLNLLGLNPASPGKNNDSLIGQLAAGGLVKYETAVKNKDKEDNRLVTLLSNEDPVNILQYSGGPGSVLGIGDTSITYADQRTGNSNPQSSNNPNYFYTGSRWNDRTTGSFISPLTKGASSKYEDYTGNVGSLIFQDGDPIVTIDGGYSYNQNWDYTTTNSGSLTPRGDLNSYQTSRWNNRTTGSFISPLTKGASSKYEDYTGNVGSLIFQDGDPIVTADGGYSYDQNWDYTTTNSGSLTPRSGLNLLQTTIKSVQTRDGELEGGVRINYNSSISPSGSSNLYKSLTGTEFDNEYTDKYFFNVYDPNTTPGNTWPDNTPLIYANGTKTYSQQQLIDKENTIQGGGTGIYPSDFRKELYNINEDDLEQTENSSVISLSPDYRVKNKDRRLYMGQPGKSNNANGTKNVWNYGVKATDLTALDKITAMPMYDGIGPDTNQAINDLVKFRIAAINNDKTDGSAVYMHFRAFLDSFSDNYTATWNPVNYVGRGDTLYNYGGFGRTISLSFTAAAQSKAELIPMYKKLNYLASTLAPDYTEAGFMRGNMVRLTVGGYLYEQPGFITSLTYDVPQEASWEIAINAEGGSDSSVKEMPHMIRVTGLSFTPIHNFLAQKPNSANNPTSRFISLSNGVNSNYNDTYRKYQGGGDGGGDNNIAT